MFITMLGDMTLTVAGLCLFLLLDDSTQFPAAPCAEAHRWPLGYRGRCLATLAWGANWLSLRANRKDQAIMFYLLGAAAWCCQY